MSDAFRRNMICSTSSKKEFETNISRRTTKSIILSTARRKKGRETNGLKEVENDKSKLLVISRRNSEATNESDYCIEKETTL